MAQFDWTFQSSATIADPAGNSLINLPFTDGQTYTVNKSLAFNSIGVSDGWMLESSETSMMGGTMNAAATTFILGDDAGNRQYRAILSFNTASLPDAAVIQSAVLSIRQSVAPTGPNPFSTLGVLVVDIRKPYFGTLNSLQLGDFQRRTFGIECWCV